MRRGDDGTMIPETDAERDEAFGSILTKPTRVVADPAVVAGGVEITDRGHEVVLSVHPTRLTEVRDAIARLKEANV